MPELASLIEHSLSSSVKDCFQTTINMDLTEGLEIVTPNPENTLICSVGFTGKIEGNVALIIIDMDACKIVGQMLGMEFPGMCSDVKDGFGELGNMIAGGLRTRMVQAGYNCEITVPTTIVGQNLELSFPNNVSQIKRCFHGQGIGFCVIVDYKVHQEDLQKMDTPFGIKESALARLRAKINEKQKIN